MAAAKSLADGKTTLHVLAAAPANKAAITAAEVLAGDDVSGDILFSDYDLGPTGSTTIDEKPLNATGQFQVFDQSQFGGGVTIFRQIDTTDGQPDATADATFAMFSPKGTVVHLVEITNGIKAAPSAGDEYNYYEVMCDDAMRPNMTGYIKKRVPLAVQNAFIGGTVAAGA